MNIRIPRVGVTVFCAVLVAAVPAGFGADKAGATKAPTKQSTKAKSPSKTPDVVYVPTPQAVVDKMLELAEIKPDDVVYDLGCGDGRIVVTAAKKYGVKAVGFDIDPQRVKEARENVRVNGVEHLVRIEEADVFTLDLREASVITLYLLPALNVRLMPQLAQMRPGSRILSHNFDMRGAKPLLVHHVTLDAAENPSGFDDEDMNHTVYKWIVPWQPEPTGK